MASKAKRMMNCRFPQPGASHRLFCFPWAGGGSNFYAAWGKKLPANIEVHGIMLAGRESRFGEKPSSSAQDIVAQIADTILSQFADKPFIFFGHSMGCLLCYETAVLLKNRSGPQPERMYLSGVSAPHSKGRQEEAGKFSTMSDEDFREHIRMLGGTPPEILDNREMMDLLMPAIKADYTVYEQIVHEHPGFPVLSCDFSFFDGADDAHHDYDSWKELTTGSFSLRKLPGGHFYLKEQHSEQQILDAIQRDFPVM